MIVSWSLLTYGGLWGCSNVTFNTMIITTTYTFIGMFDKWSDISRVRFTPPTMEIYSYGPLGVTSSVIVWPDTGYYVTGMMERNNKKEEQNW